MALLILFKKDDRLDDEHNLKKTKLDHSCLGWSTTPKDQRLCSFPPRSLENAGGDDATTVINDLSYPLSGARLGRQQALRDFFHQEHLQQRVSNFSVLILTSLHLVRTCYELDGSQGAVHMGGFGG